MAANGFDDDQTRSFTNLAGGTIVSHYKIISKIGAGGMGEVYLTEDTQLDRKVALKFLPPHLAQDEAARARFTREAKAAAKLDHPNIVQVFEVGEFQGRPFFAMAHVEGKSLREVIKEGKLSINDTIEYAKQICEGLHKAHESGIVHRDIKPGNIIIDNDNKARILDFGLATVSGEDKLTKTGSTLGTVGYMSPEQIEGKRVDHRSDLFSVGVILYEMLTGRRPFEGDNDATVARSITDTTPEPIARYKSGTTGELQQIVDKALTKDPALRYQHADGMLADLKRLHASVSVPRRGKVIRWVTLGAFLVIIIILVLTQPWSKRSSMSESGQIMLAVLPFENLGTEEDEVFADGVTEEITSRLGMIRELGVISRTSTMRYKNTDKALPVIAKELGVEYILEGTVRWDDRGDIRYVRITPQLIDASKNTHVWTDIYEEKLESVFQIQGSIASDIAAELDLTLVESVRKEMESLPTDNIDAYTAYVRALEYDRLPGNNSENIERSRVMYEQAIKLDSNFALAWAGLSYCQLRRFDVFDRLTTRLERAKEAAEMSLSINPELAEAHSAMGYYYILCSRFDEALNELALAERYRPSLARIYDQRAIVYEKRDGFSDASEKESLKAVKLDPLDGSLLTSVATMYLFRRELDKVIEYMDRAIALAPDEPAGYAVKAIMLLEGGYDIDAIREIYEHPVPKSVEWPYKFAVDVEIAARNYYRALSMLDTCVYKFPEEWRYFRLKRAWVTWLKGDTVAARSIYDSARVDLEKAVQKEDRNNELEYNELARCYAILGEKEKAIDASEKVLGYVAGDNTANLDRKGDLARTYALVGEYDKAIDLLEEILAVPHKLSVPALKMHPEWDTLRDHPRFNALLAKHSSK